MVGGIVLAKGRSVRLPRKNLRPLCGRPLLTYALEAAGQAQRLNAVWVSTEDAEIAQVASQWGAHVLIRPEELAADDVSDVEVLDYVLQRLSDVETIVMISATRPLLTAEDIDACITLYQQSQASGALAMTEVSAGAWYMSATLNEQRQVVWRYPIVGLRQTSRQSIEAQQRIYRPVGIWVVSRETFFRYGSVYVPDMLAYLVPQDRAVDINDEIDLAIAECLLVRREQQRQNEST